MSEKKRKRENGTERPNKKAAIASPPNPDNVKVTILEDLDSGSPVLASTPGLSLPTTASFKSYFKPRPQTSRSAPPTELLLCSPANAKLDYVAREEQSLEAGGLLKHYVGVYDPDKGDLQLVPARKIIVRGILRTAAPQDGAVQEVDGSQNTPSSRSALGLAFGTKKSQKAIRSVTENAISPSKRPTSSHNGKPGLDPLASAVIDSMASTTADMPTREEMQADINQSKPIPRPNMEAETPGEVWTLDSLVELQTLRIVQVKEWTDKVKNGEEIMCKSRFVANRVEKVVASENIKCLRGLRYLLLLVEWYLSLKKAGGKSGGLKVPRREQLQESLPGWGSELVEGVGRKFAVANQLNTWHTNNLLTHILALALVLDKCTTDTHDIRDDLRLDNKEISTLHTELSCPLTAPTEPELKRLKMSKTEAMQSGHRFARLRLPLQFPKMRILASKGRKR